MKGKAKAWIAAAFVGVSLSPAAFAVGVGSVFSSSPPQCGNQNVDVSGTISPLVGKGLPANDQANLQKAIVAGATASHVPPDFEASIYYIENFQGGDSGGNDATGTPVGDGQWRDPAPPYGNGPPYATSYTGAEGPFQFEWYTWPQYGGSGNPLDLFQAAMAAGKLLAADGAANTTNPSALQTAAQAYNGTGPAAVQYSVDVMSVYDHLSGQKQMPVSGTASSSSSGVCSGADVSAYGYENPLRSVQQLRPERIDQGVDFGGQGPVYALGDGTITNLTNSGWNYGGYDAFIVEHLSAGAAAGKYVYVAEACVPTQQLVQAFGSGQPVKVNSKTVICNMINPSSTGIETGWANSVGSTTESQMPEAGSISGASACIGVSIPTLIGLNYNNLLTSLGAPSGLNQGQGQTCGIMPSGWPSWRAKTKG
jgi:hypothetical protein